MRRLVLLALVVLSLPLSAHGRWRGPRRGVAIVDSCRPYRVWERNRGWEHGDRGRYRHEDCDDRRVILRPLPRPLTPPFQGRVELWVR